MLEELLPTQPSDNRAVFVDMNSFFASVEQELRPELRGRPVGVCPFLSNATCIIAASIEAKRSGIKTGTNVGQAKLLCPGITLVEARPPAYRDYHKRIMETLDQTRCQVIIKSIDEALLLVPRDLRGHTTELALEIKNNLDKLGTQLKASIGIAPNQFLAKMASNFKKPNGLTRVPLSGLEDFYSQLRLTDLHGVSWRMARRFNQIGVATPLDLYRAPYQLLRRSFGLNGEAWYLRLRGHEIDQAPTTRRMIGHQTTITPHATSDPQVILGLASQLTYKAAVRLRAAGYAARGVVVYLRYNDRSGWQRLYHGRHPFCDSPTFLDHVQRLLTRHQLRRPVRLVSVSAIDLVPLSQTTRSLFDEAAGGERLSEALDQLNARYGPQTVQPAEQLLAGPARDAVGFGNAAQAARELPPSSQP